MQLSLPPVIKVSSTDTDPTLNLISDVSKYALAKPEAAIWLSLISPTNGALQNALHGESERAEYVDSKSVKSVCGQRGFIRKFK